MRSSKRAKLDERYDESASSSKLSSRSGESKFSLIRDCIDYGSGSMHHFLTTWGKGSVLVCDTEQ